MSRVYAAGVKATAIANIKADIESFIYTTSDGTLALKEQAMREYLQTQFQAISTDGEGASADASMAAALNAPVQAHIDSLTSAGARLVNMGGYPTTPMSQSSYAAAVKAGFDDLNRLSQAVSSHFADLNSRLFDIVTEFYYAEGVDASVPAGVVIQRDTRFYIQTFVTDKGEESGPGPVSAILRPDQNDTVTIVPTAAPSGRGITHFRLYRSESGYEGDDFRLIPNPADDDGWPIATASVSDDLDATELQGSCRTLTWTEPPTDSRYVMAGENGNGALCSGNDWCPWVPFHPYAYRPQDRKSTEHPIVAQGYLRGAFVVLTRGFPYLINGTDPTAMSAQPLRDAPACASDSRGVVSMRGMVLYPTGEGLCAITLDGWKILTGPPEQGGFDLFDQESWAALDPSSITASEFDGCYLFKYTGGSGGAYLLNVATGKLVEVADGLAASALWRDPITDTLYYASGTAIKSFATADTRRDAVWEKEVTMNDHPFYSWLRVDGAMSASSQVTVKLYGNDTLRRTVSLPSRKPVRGMAGRYDKVKLRLESKARISNATLCSNDEELKQT
jgi:hypothetical protein